MIECAKCGKVFDTEKGGRPLASISGSLMGDEYIESYFFCESCGTYTVEIYHDRFLGDSTVFIRGPVPKAEGDAKVQLIGRCPEPWDKKCRCTAHMEYFQGQLD